MTYHIERPDFRYVPATENRKNIARFLPNKTSFYTVAPAAAAKFSVVSESLRPHRRQPTRLPRPWDSPGKNSGVGCHFLLQCMKVKKVTEKSLSRAQLFATPWTAAYQAPPSMGFSRQEYWSGVPLPSPPWWLAVKNPPAMQETLV